MAKKTPYLKPGAESIKNIDSIAQYWSESNTIKIDVISISSQYVALWKCTNSLDHTFKRKVATMVNRTQQCPVCNSLELLTGFNDLATLNPKLALEWSDKNTTLSNSVTGIDDKTSYLWIGSECKHEWLATIKDRNIRGFGCPYCAGQRVLAGFNDFASHYPDLIKNWDHSKNSLKPEEVSKKSNKKIWWLCDSKHSIMKSPKDWLKHGCTYCSGRVLLVGFNDLFTVKPELEKEWDFEKNTLDPREVRFNYREKAYWSCSKCSNSWSTAVRSRVKGANCPVCANESNLEKSVLGFIESFYSGEILQRKKPLITSENRRLELDFWLPELKLAIEVQDFATHSKNSDSETTDYRASKLGVTHKKGPTYHEHKRALAKTQLDVTLIDVWEDTVFSGLDGFKEILKSQLSPETLAKLFNKN